MVEVKGDHWDYLCWIDASVAMAGRGRHSLLSRTEVVPWFLIAGGDEGGHGGDGVVHGGVIHGVV